VNTCTVALGDPKLTADRELIGPGNGCDIANLAVGVDVALNEVGIWSPEVRHTGVAVLILEAEDRGSLRAVFKPQFETRLPGLVAQLIRQPRCDPERSVERLARRQNGEVAIQHQ
jgi:hypothetical protein